MIADSSEIRFACSQCGQSLLVDSAGAGISLNCPTCDHPVVVPTPAALHDRRYGESAPAEPSRADFADASGTIPATEAQDLREEIVEALRRADESEKALGVARKEAARLQQQLKKTAEDNERLAANATAAQTEAKIFQTERQQLKGDLAQSRHSATLAESQLSDARQKIAQTEAALAALEENRAQWEQAFSRTAEGAQTHEAQLAALATELDEVRAAGAANEQACLEAQGEIEALRGERAEFTAQIEAAQGALRDTAALRSALAVADEKLAASVRAIETVEADRQSIAGRCAALRHEAETLRQDLSASDSGRELLDLRVRFQTAEAGQARAAASLSRLEAETKTLTASEQRLRAELTEARERGADAERRADAASETALKQDNEVLRGIIARQNTVLEERFVELRRLKRARLFLRILYTFVGLGLVGVAALALKLLPQEVQHFLTDWFPF